MVCYRASIQLELALQECNENFIFLEHGMHTYMSD
jgi:hypothetical protein